MTKQRLEACTDGVLAIVITIMVLELKVPHAFDAVSLARLGPTFLGYILSFLYIALYWTRHHYLMHHAVHISARSLWINLHFLFWLSLIPFASGYLGEGAFTSLPVALYGIVLLFCTLSYWTFACCLAADTKKKIHPFPIPLQLVVVSYICSIPLAFITPFLSLLIYVAILLFLFASPTMIPPEFEPPETTNDDHP